MPSAMGADLARMSRRPVRPTPFIHIYIKIWNSTINATATLTPIPVPPKLPILLSVRQCIYLPTHPCLPLSLPHSPIESVLLFSDCIYPSVRPSACPSVRPLSILPRFQVHVHPEPQARRCELHQRLQVTQPTSLLPCARIKFNLICGLQIVRGQEEEPGRRAALCGIAV